LLAARSSSPEGASEAASSAVARSLTNLYHATGRADLEAMLRISSEPPKSLANANPAIP
jgi:hypothetical protein